jgi:hypothetical protein
MTDSYVDLDRFYRKFWGRAVAVRETAPHFERVRPDHVTYVAPDHADAEPGTIAAVFEGHVPGALVLAAWGGTIESLAEVIGVVRSGGRRVVALQPLGGAEVQDEPYTVMDYARAVSQVVSEFGSFHSAVAHSVGCPALALSGAIDHATGPVVFLAPFVDLSRMVELMARKAGMDTAFVHRALDHFSLRLDVPISALRLGAALGGSAPKVLAIHDADDRVIPIQDVRRELVGTGVELVVTEGLGHRRLLGDHEVLEQVRRHIAR